MIRVKLSASFLYETFSTQNVSRAVMNMMLHHRVQVGKLVDETKNSNSKLIIALISLISYRLGC